ncbi:MAG: hypothetical protein ACI841_001356 [Planctomycetota bacterium]|jgi:hypothetical protein
MQPIIKNRRVRLESKPLACNTNKQVQLLEDEGVLRAIEIHCSCGETTVIELDYTEPKPASNGDPS